MEETSIAGRGGGYKMGKIAGMEHFAAPLETGLNFMCRSLNVNNSFCAPSSAWLNKFCLPPWGILEIGFTESRVKLVSHQTISPPTKKIGQRQKTKKSPILFVSFFVRIGENPTIWVSHSPTIKDFKKLFLRYLNT